MIKKDLKFVRGDDKRYLITLLNANGEPVKLDNITLDLHARVDGGDPVIMLSLGAGIELLSDGMVAIEFSHEATQQADYDIADYDLQMTLAGKRTTLMMGRIRLIHDITRV